jgi:ornithine cyclodeaminase/alanine dehydrogenase-like protein (mu-crystallin family)
MTLLITEDETRAALDLNGAIAAVEAMFRATGERSTDNSPRIEMPAGDGYLLFRAAAMHEAGVIGFKVLTNFGTRPRQMWNHLYAIDSGELLAIVQSAAISKLRTAAASAVAVRHLAPEGAKVVGVYGTGRQAETQLEAIVRVRPITRAQVYSRTADKCAAFAQRMTERLGFPVVPLDAPQDVPQGADIVVTITSAEEPVLRGAWLGDPALIVAVGANEWYQRELDEAAVGLASLVVVDDLADARSHSGDLLGAEARGRLRWHDVVSLGDVMAGRARPPAKGLVLFESHGIALQDVAVTHTVWRAAVAQGLGRTIAL